MISKLMMAVVSSVLFTGSLACTPKAAPVVLPAPAEKAGAPSTEGAPEKGWQEKWAETLDAAKKEGRIIIYTTLSPAVRTAISTGFKQETGIEVDTVPGRGSELAQKVLSEDRAGIHLVDVFIGGTTTMATVLKPSGLLKPLAPELILPEVKDPNVWWQKRLPFIDKEGKYIFSFRATPGGTSDILINTRYTPGSEFTSYHDLLNPKWKGKITMQDPTTPGKGLQWFSVGVTIKVDEDFMRALSGQQILLTRQQRQQVEWVVRNKYPVALAADTDTTKEFQDAGIPLSFPQLKERGPYITAGSGNIILFKENAHPAAARAFLNWLLTRKGQTIFSKAYVAQSARVDVPTEHLLPYEIRDPEVKYFMAEQEDFLRKRGSFVSLAKELFGQ